MAGCVRCDWYIKGGGFTCHWPWGVWDVNAAEEILAGRASGDSARIVTLSPRSLKRMAARDGWFDPKKKIYHPAHVPHVDPWKPGILGTVSDVPGRRLFLLEGQHRAIRCLLEGRPLSFHVLTREETDRVTLKRRRRKERSHRASMNVQTISTLSGDTAGTKSVSLL